MADFTADKLKALPIESLISGPLVGAVNAQKLMSASMKDFIEEVALDKNGDVKNVTFSYMGQVEKRDEETGELKSIDTEKKYISAPFIALTGVPNLAIETVSVDFEMEITTSSEEKSTTETNASASGGGFLWVPKITGSVSHKAEQTRKTDTRAKYTVHVEAKKQPTPEPLMRIIDFITTDVTQPTLTAPSKGEEKLESKEEHSGNKKKESSTENKTK